MASVKTDIPQDSFLIGIGVSPGIAIGGAQLVNRARMAAIERRISPDQIEAETGTFREAVKISKQQLEEVKRRGAHRHLAEHLYIIDTHLLILDDQMLLEGTIRTIREECLNAAGALKRTLDRFREVFDAIEDEYLRDRRSDIDSVGERLLRNLLGESQQSLASIDRKVIVVAHDLSPADTMQIDKEHILGFVTDVGGRTSHTAILARSLGIPAVVGLEKVSSLVPGGTPMIIDGGSGTVVLNPSPETIREYQQKQQTYASLEQELLTYRALPAETPDQFRISLKANIELPEEIPAVRSQGAEGIGLFRSEFLFVGQGTPPDENRQFETYKAIVEQMAPHEVTIRTLDVGGDKFVPDINLADERNPALGLRGVRFSLAERKLFQTQLRAILRASAFGKLRLMLPMVSGVAEIRNCRKLLQEIMQELRDEGCPFDERIALGVMVETPSAGLIPDLLAKEVDFFSIGTNDLIQYCLAVDRGNEHVAYLYEPTHPAVLRALQAICRAGRQAGIPVAMCGEMASEPLYIPVLLGLGLTELSMNAPCIPRVKRILRQFPVHEAELLLEQLLHLPTAKEVTEKLEQDMSTRFPDLFGGPSF